MSTRGRDFLAENWRLLALGGIALAAPLAAALWMLGPAGGVALLVGELVFSAILALVLTALFTDRLRDAFERKMLGRIRDSEARYRSLVELLPALVYSAEFGEEGTTREVSPQIEAILGYEAPDWRAAGRQWHDRIHPDDRAHVLESELASQESGEALRCEYRMVASDGNEIWVRDEALIVGDNGTRHLQGVIYDISDQKEAEAVLEERTESLGRTVRAQTMDLRESELETVYRLAIAAEFRDDETHEHTMRVGRAAALLAAELGLPIDQIEMIELAAPLHDIGKLGIPDAILRKPERLTPEERALMRRHVEIGSQILEGSGSEVLRMGAEIALTHHERWDGTGYPRGLAEEEIPIFGRITAVVDAFDVMTHRRPYKNKWPIEQALAELRLSAGTHFDPGIAEAFEELDHEKLVRPVEGVEIVPNSMPLRKGLALAGDLGL